MSNNEGRSIRTSAWPTALRWAATTFVLLAVIGWVVAAVCARHHCLSGTPKWASGIAIGYVVLALPWLLVYFLGKPHDANAASSPEFVAVGAAATLALLVLVGRLWFVRFRDILTSPLPEPASQEGAEPSLGAPSFGPVIMVLMLVTALLIALVNVVSTQGFNGAALLQFSKVAGFVIVLTMIPFYFEVRRSKRPNKLEMCLALLWMAFRRTSLGLVALLFAMFAVTAWRHGAGWAAALALLIAGAAAWWGWFGTGYRRGFADDRPAHEARKRRYGW